MDITGALQLAKRRELKTLFVDIERLPGSFTADFWDLNAYKGRRIHPDSVNEWPRTICFAALWYGDKRPAFYSEWEHGADDMHQAAWDLYDQADIVITYNGVSFDNKHITSGWVERDMKRPSPWRDIDLLKVARQSQGWESKTLNSVCRRLGVETKDGKYDVETARAAVAGDARAQRYLKRYNLGDVTILPAVYERLMPWIKGHPHVAPTLGLEHPTCPRCGSDNVQRNGTHTPAVIHYLRYLCGECGGHFRTTSHSRGPSVHAL